MAVASLCYETDENVTTLSGFDLRVFKGFISGAMFAPFRLKGIVIQEYMVVSSFNDCVEKLEKYLADWPSEIQWAPTWHLESTE